MFNNIVFHINRPRNFKQSNENKIMKIFRKYKNLKIVLGHDLFLVNIRKNLSYFCHGLIISTSYGQWLN